MKIKVLSIQGTSGFAVDGSVINISGVNVLNATDKKDRRISNDILSFLIPNRLKKMGKGFTTEEHEAFLNITGLTVHYYKSIGVNSEEKEVVNLLLSNNVLQKTKLQNNVFRGYVITGEIDSVLAKKLHAIFSLNNSNERTMQPQCHTYDITKFKSLSYSHNKIIVTYRDFSDDAETLVRTSDRYKVILAKELSSYMHSVNTEHVQHNYKTYCERDLNSDIPNLYTLINVQMLGENWCSNLKYLQQYCSSDDMLRKRSIIFNSNNGSIMFPRYAPSRDFTIAVYTAKQQLCADNTFKLLKKLGHMFNFKITELKDLSKVTLLINTSKSLEQVNDIIENFVIDTDLKIYVEKESASILSSLGVNNQFKLTFRTKNVDELIRVYGELKQYEF